MKKIIVFLIACNICVYASAQGLSLIKKYGSKWEGEIVTCKNKPNGYIYRLREDIQTDELPNVVGSDHEMFIAEPIDIGWLALFRLPTSSDNYDFVVALYNERKENTGIFNLCDITGNRYCEVQDVRWDGNNGNILFNMACPSYSSSINGKGSKLYCYNIYQNRIVWQTDYLVSNDIFIINDNYVFCSYGFTNEKDYLFMLNKHTGKIYSKILMPKKVEYMEIHNKNGQDVLYVVDYNDYLYTYKINDTGTYNSPVGARPKGLKR